VVVNEPSLVERWPNYYMCQESASHDTAFSFQLSAFSQQGSRLKGRRQAFNIQTDQPPNADSLVLLLIAAGRRLRADRSKS
jgi:hypothetical protein